MRYGHRVLLAAVLVTGALVGGIGTAVAESRTAMVTGEATSTGGGAGRPADDAELAERWCVVPNVKYMDYNDALDAIHHADCGEEPDCQLYDDVVGWTHPDAFFVATQSPLAGFLLPCNGRVLLTLDTGCVVPNVKDLPLQTAYDRLAAARLRSTTTGEGKFVKSQSPAADRHVSCHSAVNLTLRRGRFE
jgi:hypothetical protein